MAPHSVPDLSIGGVASTVKPVVLPKKFRKTQSNEQSSYRGAGILPFTLHPEKQGEVVVLFHQRSRGKFQGVRLVDFGGKKSGAEEFPSKCACRQFAKQTYGLFGLDSPSSDEEVKALTQEIERPGLGEGSAELKKAKIEGRLNLMVDQSNSWAQLRLLRQSSCSVFYSSNSEYFLYLLPVPYVDPSLLGAMSKAVDKGKRSFLWLNASDILQVPLTPRLHITPLVEALQNWSEDFSMKEQSEDLKEKPEKRACSFALVNL